MTEFTLSPEEEKEKDLEQDAKTLTVEQQLDAMGQHSKSEVLIELCSFTHSEVEDLGLDDIKKHTITYVDNNNKSVLLINKYLMSLGRLPIPVIVPSLAPQFLDDISQLDRPAQQGDILLFADDTGSASLGIIVSSAKVSNHSMRVLTTSGDDITTVTFTEADEDKLICIMR